MFKNFREFSHNVLSSTLRFLKRNIITISSFVAMYAVFFCVQPVWHEEVELSPDAKQRLDSIKNPCLSDFMKKHHNSLESRNIHHE